MAPVLALLEEVRGVAQSRVDWTGKRFLLELDRGAEVDEVVADADEVIGGDARRLARREEDAAIAGYRRGERWMRSGETLALSREEARVLALRHGQEAARETGLDPEQTAKLVLVIEGEIAAAFEKIHAAGKGLPPDLDAVFAGVIERSLEKSRRFLSEAQIQALREHVSAGSSGG